MNLELIGVVFIKVMGNIFGMIVIGRPPDVEIIQKFGKGTILASDDQNQKFGTKIMWSTFSFCFISFESRRFF